MTEFDKLSEETDLLGSQIHELLAGRSPEVQGAVLAGLVATWLAGHRPDIRTPVLEAWNKLMNNLLGIADKATHRIYGNDPWSARN